MREVMTVRDWLKGMGLLTAGNASVKDCQAKASAYGPMLAREFRHEAFTAASLAAVARGCTFFPSFGEICTALSAWWEDNRPFEPTVPLLTGPKPDIPKPREPATEAELAAVADIMRQWRMQTGYAKSRRLEPDTAAPQPKPQPKPLSDGVLLAQWEAMGPAGAIRAEALRRKIADHGKPTQETTP